MVTAVVVVISVTFLFFYTGGDEKLTSQLDKLISPAVKQRFEGFKVKFHKTYPNATEEEKRLVIFDANLKELYKRQE